MKTTPQKLKYMRDYHARNRERENLKRKLSYRKNFKRQRATNEKWKRLHPEKVHEYHLKRRYDIDRATYDRLLKEQGGVCAICGSSSPGRKGSKWFAVDHDHKTNRIRGLLCQPCNLMIGKARDNPRVLRAAAKYLSRRLPCYRGVRTR